MTEMKLNRKVITSIGKTYFIDSEMNMVGIKGKDGVSVPFSEFKAFLESKGSTVMLTNDYVEAK